MRKLHPIQTTGDLGLRIVRVLLVGVVIGVAASLLAFGLIALVSLGSEWIGLLKNRYPPLVAAMITVGTPALGGLLVGLIVHRMSERRPHNPADVILAAQSNLKLTSLKIRDGIYNYIASIVSLVSGASVGQYGPIVNMGATLAVNLRRWVRADATVLIGCGVAAAISAAFNAPIAGIVFAHEAILRHFSLRAFAPITIAASAAFYVSTFIFDSEHLFQTEFMQILYLGEFAAFTLVGILAGLLAVLFLHSILYARLLSSRIALNQKFRPMIAGLMVGILALEVPEILGIGDNVMRQTLYAESLSALHIGEILLAKFVASALCLGFGFAGGVFSPALLIGVLFGSLFGLSIDLFMPHSNIAVYAVCGMAAVTSPIIGAPLTTILIIFELTHSYELTTAVMISVVFSNMVSYRLFGRSLFDFQLKSRGFDLSQGRDPLILSTMTIANIARRACTRLKPGSNIPHAIEQLVADEVSEAYVVDEHQHFIGRVTLAALLAHGDSRQALMEVESLVDPHSLRFHPGTSIWDAMHDIKGYVGESIPIVDRDNGTLVGIIHESDLIRAYMQSAHELRSEETANA